MDVEVEYSHNEYICINKVFFLLMIDSYTYFMI